MLIDSLRNNISFWNENSKRKRFHWSILDEIRNKDIRRLSITITVNKIETLHLRCFDIRKLKEESFGKII